MKKKLLFSFIAVLALVGFAFAAEVVVKDASTYWEAHKTYLTDICINGAVSKTKANVDSAYYKSAVDAFTYYNKQNGTNKGKILTKVKEEITSYSGDATELLALLKTSNENIPYAVMNTLLDKYGAYVSAQPETGYKYNPSTVESKLDELKAAKMELVTFKRLVEKYSHQSLVTFQFDACIANYTAKIQALYNSWYNTKSGAAKTVEACDALLEECTELITEGKLAADALCITTINNKKEGFLQTNYAKELNDLLKTLTAKESFTLGTNKNIDLTGDYADLKRVKELWGVRGDDNKLVGGLLTEDKITADAQLKVYYLYTTIVDELVETYDAMVEAVEFIRGNAVEGGEVPFDGKYYTYYDNTIWDKQAAKDKYSLLLDLSSDMAEIEDEAVAGYVEQIFAELEDVTVDDVTTPGDVTKAKDAYIEYYMDGKADEVAEAYIAKVVANDIFTQDGGTGVVTANLKAVTADDYDALKVLADTYHKYAYIKGKSTKTTSISSSYKYEFANLNSSNGKLTTADRYAIGEKVKELLAGSSTGVMMELDKAMETARKLTEGAALAARYTEAYSYVHTTVMGKPYVAVEDMETVKPAITAYGNLGGVKCELQKNTNCWNWVGITLAEYKGTTDDIYVGKDNESAQPFGNSVISTAKNIVKPIYTDLTNINAAAKWLADNAELIALGAPGVVETLTPANASEELKAKLQTALTNYGKLALNAKIAPATYDQFYAAWYAVFGVQMPEIATFKYVDGTGKETNLTSAQIAKFNGSWKEVEAAINAKIADDTDAKKSRNTVAIFTTGAELSATQIAALPANVIYQKGAEYIANEINFTVGGTFKNISANVKVNKLNLKKKVGFTASLNDLYVPFAISAANMAKLNAAGVYVYYYSGVTETEKTPGNVELAFGYRLKKGTEQTYAYKPYLIKTSGETVTEVSLDDVTLEAAPSEPGNITFDVAVATFKFTGTNEPANYTKGDIVLKDGKLMNVDFDGIKGSTRPGFNPGSVKLSSTPRAGIEYSIRIYDEDGNEEGVTSIVNVKSEDSSNDAIYNINGVKVNSISAPGIYIKNGKKIIVK